ncbi:hypothetical protein HPB52_024943 [Rhipicephalus sanguineus]|uniref:Uncharacterized protein n=1 Tax=Rhipicephalus sanguineus TaxID=34632 RepID=A0A9D4SMA7_RHISA|nr:hypothetical protein HPB52_024943 [Rhipicephalus sanguineus]
MVQREPCEESATQRAVAGTSSVTVLGGASVPRGVQHVLENGPKYSYQPSATRSQLVAMVRDVASRASEPDRERAIADGVDCLLRTTHKTECPLRVIVSEKGTWQDEVSSYLQRCLGKLDVQDPFLVRSSTDLVQDLAQGKLTSNRLPSSCSASWRPLSAGSGAGRRRSVESGPGESLEQTQWVYLHFDSELSRSRQKTALGEAPHALFVDPRSLGTTLTRTYTHTLATSRSAAVERGGGERKMHVRIDPFGAGRALRSHGKVSARTFEMCQVRGITPGELIP